MHPLLAKFPLSLRCLFLAAILSALLLASCTSAPATPTTALAPTIQLTDCQISAPGSSQEIDAQCGKLSVYEDRAAGTGRQIELNIAVVSAVSRSPAPDPLFFLAGGPGEAATQSYVTIYTAFERIRQKRNIVLVDQRGTGDSHPLQCDSEDEEQTPEDETSSDDSDAQLAESLRSCLKTLDADPRLYTTSIAMDDLDQVRAALGYEQINLYGVSYGTRAALVYLRQHPNRVRSIILDGAAPPNWTLGPTTAGDGQRTLQMLFDRCAAEPGCQQTFPNLPGEFQALADSLRAEPVEVKLDDPISGEPITTTLTYERMASALHTSSYAPETAALIPLMIHNAYALNDFRSIAALSISTSHDLEESINTGMRFSVVCAEDVPFFASGTASEGYLGSYVTDAFSQICQVWPRGEIPSDFKEPVRSDVPTLILSGGADPVTPPANGDLTAQTLPNSLHLVAPGMGHANIFRGCITRIATAFIESGSIQGLDTACVEQIAPMPFFVNFSGPTP